MSLAVLADHMASKGRGPDSMLIHMSPNEVQGLQALAMKHGGSLTINPDTGLPEAGFLDKLLPTIIGAGISFFSGGTIDPMTAAGIVGGIQTARTGDIGKGISAGLGAYGGASLTSGLTTTGTNVLTGEATSIAAGDAARLAGEEAVRNGIANNFTPEMLEAAKMEAIDTAGSNTARLGTDASNFDKLSTGAKTAANNPLQYLKDNAKPLMMAAGPAILAEMGVKQNMPQTTTKPGMITPYSYFNGQYVAGNPYEAQVKKAASGGVMGFDESSNSPMSHQSLSNMQDAGGMFNFAHDGGGVMKMAEGGVAHYELGGTVAADLEKAYAAKDYSKVNELVQANRVSEADVQNQWKGLDTSGLAGLGVNLFNPNSAAASYVTTAAANPNITTADFITGANTAGVGLTAPLATALDKSGLSAASQYALTHADIGSPLNAEETYGGLKGLSSNINYVAGGLQNLIGAGKLTGQGAREQAIAEMKKYGINEADIKRATGKTLAELFPDQIKQVTQVIANQGDTAIIPGVNDYGLGGKGTSGALEDVLGTALPLGVSGAGITTVNPNGTITTRPDIPGIPAGGFTGMKDVRKAYTDGGGSLGYIPYTPKTIDEFNAKYKNTGGSKQGYDYLSGKTDYTPTPYTKDGQIAKPYNESVLGMPVASSSKMYIFQNGKFVPNPNYAIPTYDKDGKKTYNVTNADVKAFMDKSPSTDAFYTWATTNNLSPEQIALASGRPINEISKLFTGAKDLVDDSGKIDTAKVDAATAKDIETNWDEAAYLAAHPDVANELKTGKSVTGQPVQFTSGYEHWLKYGKDNNVQPTTKKAAEGGLAALTMARGGTTHMPFFSKSTGKFTSRGPQVYADGGMPDHYNLGGYSDGGRLLRGPGDGVSDSIPATIGNKRPARLADGEFVVPARIVSELGNGSTEAGARKLYAMMDRVQAARKGSIGKGKVAKNSRADKYLPV